MQLYMRWYTSFYTYSNMPSKCPSSTTEKLLKSTLPLQRTNLPLQYINAVILERFLDPLPRLRVLCDSSRRACCACQETQFTSQEQAADREEEVGRCVAPAGGAGDLRCDVGYGLCGDSQYAEGEER
jgi:hypothetical protein